MRAPARARCAQPASVVGLGDQRRLGDDRETVERPPRARVAAGELETGIDPDLVHATTGPVAPETLAEDLACRGEDGRPDIELPRLHRLLGRARLERAVDEIMDGLSRRRGQHLDREVVADHASQRRPRVAEQRGAETLEDDRVEPGAVDGRRRDPGVGGHLANRGEDGRGAFEPERTDRVRHGIPRCPAAGGGVHGLEMALETLREPAYPSQVEVEGLGEGVPRLVRTSSDVAGRLPAADPFAGLRREGSRDEARGRRRDPHAPAGRASPPRGRAT